MNDTAAPIPLFEINPGLDRKALAERFAKDRRVQIRNLLTDRTARTIHRILSQETPWGLAWHAAADGPNSLRREELQAMSPAEHQAIRQQLTAAMRGRDYGFIYTHFPTLTAYLEHWMENSPHDLLMEYINAEEFLGLIRQVTGIPELVKADAQATLYAPGQFLAMHDDSHVAEGWRVAYVMNFCAEDWRPDWGGYLMFYDEDGDVITGFKPRFNALNLFAVPQKHNVTMVPPFAPVGRFAITGWFRDR
jgi:Rps23 Pro-64 3,4-dihydroxylase Tpa1-like proline 4-hydroxylase